MMPAAFNFSQSALNSAQVAGMLVIPALSRAFFPPHIQLIRWIFIGTATQEPLGFMTDKSSAATVPSQFSCLAISSRLRVMPVAFHSAISGPFSWTAGGGLPDTTSARNLARVLAGLPAMEVASHLPPAALNISPSLAIAAASEPSLHWLSRLVLGSASALADKSPSVKGTTATAREANRTFIFAGGVNARLVGRTICYTGVQRTPVEKEYNSTKFYPESGLPDLFLSI